MLNATIEKAMSIYHAHAGAEILQRDVTAYSTTSATMKQVFAEGEIMQTYSEGDDENITEFAHKTFIIPERMELQFRVPLSEIWMVQVDNSVIPYHY